MTETIHPSRSGWAKEETDFLWKEIQAAAQQGLPLREVFQRAGDTLGRKPNSVRNYYYMQLKDQGEGDWRRAAPFETFTQEEVHDLLRQVLIARGQGQSVRSCVMALSQGDKSKMLRYQNKYRSILRKKPELIDRVCRELASEGLPCPSAVIVQPLPSKAEDAWPDDPDVRTILSSLRALSRRASAPAGDRLKVQRDLLLMQLEDLQLAAKAMIGECKEFLGESEQDRPIRLAAFCDALRTHLSRLESLCD